MMHPAKILKHNYLVNSLLSESIENFMEAQHTHTLKASFAKLIQGCIKQDWWLIPEGQNENLIGRSRKLKCEQDP